MTEQLTFLPYLRRGLAGAAGIPDSLRGPLPPPVVTDAWITVAGQTVSRTVELQTAADVTGLAGQVIRSEPRPGSTGVEPGYFPLCEVAAPDLPWLMTPAAPAGHDRLRPWLVLVVVRRQDGVALSAQGSARPAVLTIASPADAAAELPDLAESWAWAHVHSSVPESDLAATILAAGSGVSARLICPRRTLPDASYLACLVPATVAGIQRGLGSPAPGEPDLSPGWDLGAVPDPLRLPVYHSWEFSTGAGGDFEALCRRLRPDGDEAVVGLHALDVTDPGLVAPAPQPVLLDMEGALTSLGAVGRPWTDRARTSFQAELTPLVDAAISTPVVVPADDDPDADDPVLTPPAYGAWPAGVAALPDTGWVPGVNLHPVHRAMAGLGAAVVRAGQEAWVAAAWDAAGDLRAAAALLAQAGLAAQVGESWARRARTLADGDLLQLTQSVHPLLSSGADTARTALESAGVPRGLFSAPYQRITRPGGTLCREWRRRVADPGARLAADHAHTVLTATHADEDAEVRLALTFARAVVPDGAQTADPTLRTLPAARGPGTTAPSPPPRPAPDAGGLVRKDLVPTRTVRAALIARSPALESALPESGLPSAPAVVPRFADPLSRDLVALGANWLVPGLEKVADDRVRLLAVNQLFVGSFLVGANTAIVQELRWRDYPIDRRATCFPRFWDYVADPDRTDIDDLSAWDLGWTVTQNMPGGVEAADAMTAVVVRGDLIQRFPDAHWFLLPAVAGDSGWEPADGPVVEVSFRCALDDRSAVYGFDLAPDVVRGDRAHGTGGYFVGVEERPGAARFGLDEAEPDDFTNLPATWDDVSWGHLVSSQEELDALTHARAAGVRLEGYRVGDTVWGRNSAHLARATWQRPFRMLMHADLLI